MPFVNPLTRSPARAAVPTRLAESLPDGSVRCGVCAHRCLVRPDRTGICGVRENRGGTLFALTYTHELSFDRAQVRDFDVRHPDVPIDATEGDGALAVLRFGHDLEIGLQREERAERLAEERLVVDQHELQLLHAGTSMVRA